MPRETPPLWGGRIMFALIAVVALLIIGICAIVDRSAFVSGPL